MSMVYSSRALDDEAATEEEEEEEDEEREGEGEEGQNARYSEHSTYSKPSRSQKVWVPEAGAIGNKELAFESFLETAALISFEEVKEPARTTYFKNLETCMKLKGKGLLFSFLDRSEIWLEKKNRRPWSKHKVEKFLDWVFEKYPSQLTDRWNDTTILIHALNSDRHLFVEVFLEREDINDVFQGVSKLAGTCLHAAIRQRSPFTQKIMEMSKDYDLFAKLDSEDDNALHALVSITDEQVSVPGAPAVATINSLRRDPQEEMLERILSDPETPRDWVLPLLQAENKSGYTPYQLRVHNLEESCKRRREPKELRRQVIVEDAIGRCIRKFCIRKLGKLDDISKCLYKSDDERYIHFDLTGYPRSSVSQKFLMKLSENMPFETELRYVALPSLSVDPPKVGKGFTTHTDLRAIFAWLRENQVKSIMKIAVIDYGEKSHKDSAIVEALEGFAIEHWTWKKVDLCSDVIADCSKHVKEVCLYWSGNYSVMMGWASKEGFMNTTKFPELKVLRLFIQEGFEEPGILRKQARAFQERMKEQDKEVVVHMEHDTRDFESAKDFRNREGGLDENPWIKSMEVFENFLRNIKTGADPIKVAVIDNGIDTTWSRVAGKVVKGKSFYPLPNSDEFYNAWFLPTSHHGTLVASIICQTCPKVQLYAARMEERQAEGGASRYTIRSAINAIKWAKECDVDIISMSWTMRPQESGGKEAKELKQLIKEAGEQKILMFASTSDQGPNDAETVCPGSYDDCIMIGAAENEGMQLPWVNKKDLAFLFPGKGIPFHDSDKDSYRYETGSSFATACASGLAGTLLYCDRVLANNGRQGRHNLRERACMENAITSLRREGTIFVDAKEKVQDAFSELLKKAGADRLSPDLMWNDKTKKAMEDFLGKICV